LKSKTLKKFPGIRLATIDIGAVSKEKHHVTAMLEMDVTDSRAALKKYRQQHKVTASFTAWLISTIAQCIQQHEQVAACLKGRQKLILFGAVNVSVIVEKMVQGVKVPVPLLIENAQLLTVETITRLIREASQQEMGEQEIVLHRKTSWLEQLYYRLPGWARRNIWRFILKRPELAFSKMGNVSVTALGMIGKAQGWFIPLTVHPVCFALGNISQKPRVINQQIVIREILNLTVMMDHDVIDGAGMARFISELTHRIEQGTEL
jgi:pyruvate/2-oxoglutarate dehydrogenase complex dihydrolipoamide acyltransferase (E2) component